MSSPYITPEGHVRLKTEYEQLWRVRRPEVVRALAEAAAEGDRSENAEYHYRKKELREIDRRVRYLQRRLPQLKVADQPPADGSRIYFGATVEVLDEHDQMRCYRIVGPDETDYAKGSISMDSPMARSLLGRAAGDLVTVQLPERAAEYEVTDVRYPKFNVA